VRSFFTSSARSSFALSELRDESGFVTGQTIAVDGGTVML